MSELLSRVRFLRDHRWAPGRMSAYLDGELASGRQARLERHTKGCPECRRLLTGLFEMLGALHRLSPPESVDAVAIAASVRVRLGVPGDRN
jgi:anti-sigma factor RsiW